MASYNVHAGHCPQGQGASGAVGFLKESIEDRKVKNRVISALKRAGHTVYDCTDDTNCTVNQNLQRIVAKCNAHSVNLDVSIHLNAGGGTGVEVWCYDEKTAKIAAAICANVSAALGIKNRGVKYSQKLYVLRKTKNPALLVECSFVDNKTDYKHWNAYKCGDAIASGITGKKIQGTTSNTSKQVKQAKQVPGNAVNNFGLYYRAHCQTVGLLNSVHDGQTSGTVGYSKRLEGLYVDIRKIKEKYPDVKLKCKAHIQGTGWKEYTNVEHDTLIGTTGQSKRLEAIELELTGLPANKVLMYRTHLSGAGWTGWVKGGFTSGTVGIGKAIEAIQIKIV